MANTNAPFGFRQSASLGAAPTYEQIVVAINYNAGAIFYGDPVTQQTDGSVAQSGSTGGAPAPLGIAGIFTGCKYLSVAQKRTVWSNYWPGSDVASGNVVEGYIVNDPGARFLVQADSSATVWVAGANGTPACIGNTVGFLIGTGNTSNGLSGAYLDNTTVSTAANNPFRIVGVLNFPPGANGTLANSTSGAYTQFIVAFNNVNTKNLTGA